MTKYKEQSNKTKRKMAEALKKLMTKNNFNQISINSIVKECNYNRNTFYYHFSDIYDLLKWTFEMDGQEILKKMNSSNDMKNAIFAVMNYIDNNKNFCLCALDSLGRDELKKFLKSDFEKTIIQLINYVIVTNNYSITEDFKNYVVYSHTELIASHLVSYLRGEFKISKEKIVNYILLTFHASLNQSLDVANKYNM